MDIKNLNLIPSIISNDCRIRFVENRVYRRPPTETFHEFLEHLAFEMLGVQWIKTQNGEEVSKQHFLIQCANDYKKRKQLGLLIDIRRESDGSTSHVPSGPTLFWFSFCYDLFILAHKKLVTDKLIDKLQNHQYFQSTRYELAIVAVMLGANCDIKWIDENSTQNKVCEFEAFHKPTGTRLVVEAKSKPREGVLHYKDKVSLYSKLENLLNDALKKTYSADAKLVVFIDINLPFVEASHIDKPILSDVKQMIEKGLGDRDDFGLILVTNFPFHYGNPNSYASPVESCIVLPKKNPPLSILNDLERSLRTYGKIPETL